MTSYWAYNVTAPSHELHQAGGKVHTWSYRRAGYFDRSARGDPRSTQPPRDILQRTQFFKSNVAARIFRFVAVLKFAVREKKSACVDNRDRWPSLCSYSWWVRYWHSAWDSHTTVSLICIHSCSNMLQDSYAAAAYGGTESNTNCVIDDIVHVTTCM